MRLRHIILYILMLLSVASVQAQSVPGSDIVSRTVLSSDGTRKTVQRVYDNGLGDIVQETVSYPNSSLPDIVVHHEYDEYRRRTRTWLPVTSSSGGGFISGSVMRVTAKPHNIMPRRTTSPSCTMTRTTWKTSWQDGILLFQ